MYNEISTAYRLHNIEFRLLRVVEKDGTSRIIQQYRKYYVHDHIPMDTATWTKWLDVPTVTLDAIENGKEQ